MPAAHEGLARDVPLAVPTRAAIAHAFLGGTAALLAAAVLAGGGADDERLAWLGAAAIALAAAAASALPVPRPGRAGLVLLASLVAWVAWSGISIAWSVEADRSWDVVNRGLAYLAFLALGMLAGSVVRRAASLVVAALAAICAAAMVWALAGKVVPALGPDVERSARLQAPVGYWNALALLLAIALPLWLALAERSRRLRAAAAAAVALSVVALALTASRGGILVAVVAVVVWLALARASRNGGRVLLAGGVPGLAVALWALTRPALTDPGLLDRAGDGALLGGLLVLAAVVAAVAAARVPAIPERGLAVAAVAAVVVAAVGVAVAVGGPGEVADRFCAGGAEAHDPRRFGTVSSNLRCTWWGEATEIWRNHPLRGSGAGTFAMARRPLREGTASPVDPHNLPLRALSETGLVGLALLLAAVGSAAVVATRALRRLTGEERLAAAALVAGAVAYLAHSLVDMGWEYVAVTAPVLVSLGVLATAGGPAPARRASRLTGAALALLALAALFSLASPRLAERQVEAAVDAGLAGEAARSAEFAREAWALNPLAVRPLWVEAAANEQLGQPREARRLYRRAAELQSRNPWTWFYLGEFESRVGNDDAALDYLERSWRLDAFGPAQHVLEDARRRARDSRD